MSDDIFSRSRDLSRTSKDLRRRTNDLKWNGRLMMIMLGSVVIFMTYEMLQPPTDEEIAIKNEFNSMMENQDCTLLKNWLNKNIKLNYYSEGGLFGSMNHGWNKYQQVDKVFELNC